MIRGFKNLPKIAGKEKQIEMIGKEETVTSEFFYLKCSTEIKELCSS